MPSIPAEKQPRPRGLRLVISEAGRAWFTLTPSEHRAVVLILGLFLLGLAVRLCRLL